MSLSHRARVLLALAAALMLALALVMLVSVSLPTADPGLPPCPEVNGKPPCLRA